MNGIENTLKMESMILFQLPQVENIMMMMIKTFSNNLPPFVRLSWGVRRVAQKNFGEGFFIDSIYKYDL